MSVWKILTLPCEEAARLASDGRDRDLKPLDRAALRAHLLSCYKCRRFKRQIEVISRAANESEPLSDEARERIRARLDEN